MALLTHGLLLKSHGLPTFSKYRLDKETSPEALIIQPTSQIHAVWIEVLLKAVTKIFPLYTRISSVQHSCFLFCPPAAGRMGKLDYGKERFPEMQLRKVLSTSSSIAAACLHIREGSLTPGILPAEEVEASRKIKAWEVCGSSGCLPWKRSAAPTPSAGGQISIHEPALTN